MSILSLFHREIFTTRPQRGDYVLSPTGLTWDVRRTNEDGGSMSVSVGEPDRKVALAAIVSLARSDKADAWEPVGPESFRLLRRHRASV